MDHMNVAKAVFINCVNVSFERPMKKVKALVLSNCKLGKVDGIQEMKQLTKLRLGLNALTDNSLKTIVLLKNLVNLAKLY